MIHLGVSGSAPIPEAVNDVFSFDDPTGAVNSNAVRTKLMADLDVGTIQPQPRILRTSQGSTRLSEPGVGPGEMNLNFTAS